MKTAVSAGVLGLLFTAGVATAAPFSVQSWDLGAVEPGAPGFFGENVWPSTGRFFRSSLTSATDKGPTQGQTSPNRIFDSYAGFDGGSLGCVVEPECGHGPFSGPTVSDSSADDLDGYDTNTSFGMVIPIGFTLGHFDFQGTAFGGGAFEASPRAASNALAAINGWDPEIFSFFTGRLTIARDAALVGGTMRVLIASEGGPADGGATVVLTRDGGPVFTGHSNNTGQPIGLSQGYQFISQLVARPDGLGNQQAPAMGPFGSGDTYDLYVVSVPGLPAPFALAAGALGFGVRRRRGA